MSRRVAEMHFCMLLQQTRREGNQESGRNERFREQFGKGSYLV